MGTRLYIVGESALESPVITALRNILADTANTVIDGHRIVAAEALAAHARARLVEATTQAEAIRHVARKYKAEVASGIQIRDLMRAGVIPEVAGDEPAGEAKP